MTLDFMTMIVSVEIDLKNKVTVVGCIPNIDIDLNEFHKYIKLIVQTKRYKMNAKYKILE